MENEKIIKVKQIIILEKSTDHSITPYRNGK